MFVCFFLRVKMSQGFIVGDAKVCGRLCMCVKKRRVTGKGCGVIRARGRK